MRYLEREFDLHFIQNKFKGGKYNVILQDYELKKHRQNQNLSINYRCKQGKKCSASITIFGRHITYLNLNHNKNCVKYNTKNLEIFEEIDQDMDPNYSADATNVDKLDKMSSDDRFVFKKYIRKTNEACEQFNQNCFEKFLQNINDDSQMSDSDHFNRHETSRPTCNKNINHQFVHSNSEREPYQGCINKLRPFSSNTINEDMISESHFAENQGFNHAVYPDCYNNMRYIHFIQKLKNDANSLQSMYERESIKGCINYRRNNNLEQLYHPQLAIDRNSRINDTGCSAFRLLHGSVDQSYYAGLRNADKTNQRYHCISYSNYEREANDANYRRETQNNSEKKADSRHDNCFDDSNEEILWV